MAQIAAETDTTTSPLGRVHGLIRYLFLVGQLGVLAVIIRQFELVNSAFLRISLIAFLGFMVHFVLPSRFRLPFFLALSLFGIGVVVGPIGAAWIVALGLVLIGACHAPVPFPARVGLLFLIGAVFAAARTDWIEAPWLHAIWPVLGSMFMFRLIIYVYDVRHGNAPASFWHTLAYFFMLPNVCFPLFPVVDYQKFHNNYYDGDEHRIYQTGIDWMARGVIHLILYRVVYYYFVMAPSEVDGAGDLAQFMLTTFLLYLKISGQFHMIVGMLHLFGFSLPETNRLYLFASSFTDFWRRINIYWKDFMMKVFYYPIYFQLRRFGTVWAIVLSTLFVFVITWLLHSYQWFWLRGTFPVIWQDGIYWTSLAVLVAANAVYEVKFGRKRALKKARWRAGEFGRRVLATLATLTVVCITWSLWTTDTLDGWLALWGTLSPQKVVEAGVIPGLLVFGLVLGQQDHGMGATGGGLWRRIPIRRSTLGTLVSLALLGLVGVPAVYTSLGSDLGNLVLSLRSDRLNRLDAATLERGYYEDLTQISRFNNELWELYMEKPLQWLDVQASGLTRLTDDFRQTELAPAMSASTDFGTITTNRWGMRDKDYEQLPAPGTYRIAMLGASVEMGWGAEDGKTFEALIEERLNRDHTGGRFDRYEILNFGVPGYGPLQQIGAIEYAFEFQPNAVFYMGHGRELSRAAFYLAEVVRKKVDNPYPFLRDVAQRAGLGPETAESDALRRLAPYKEAILAWLYDTIVEESRRRNVLAVMVFLPQTEGGTWEEETTLALRLARRAGFAVLDLTNVFEGYEPSAIQLTEWDKHPNALGHEIMARRIYEALRNHQEPVLPPFAGE